MYSRCIPASRYIRNGTPVAGARAHRGGETTAEVIVVVAAGVGPVAGKGTAEKNANIEIRGFTVRFQALPET